MKRYPLLVEGHIHTSAIDKYEPVNVIANETNFVFFKTALFLRCTSVVGMLTSSGLMLSYGW